MDISYTQPWSHTLNTGHKHTHKTLVTSTPKTLVTHTHKTLVTNTNSKSGTQTGYTRPTHKTQVTHKTFGTKHTSSSRHKRINKRMALRRDYTAVHLQNSHASVCLFNLLHYATQNTAFRPNHNAGDTIRAAFVLPHPMYSGEYRNKPFNAQYHRQKVSDPKATPARSDPQHTSTEGTLVMYQFLYPTTACSSCSTITSLRSCRY